MTWPSKLKMLLGCFHCIHEELFQYSAILHHDGSSRRFSLFTVNPPRDPDAVRMNCTCIGWASAPLRHYTLQSNGAAQSRAARSGLAGDIVGRGAAGSTSPARQAEPHFMDFALLFELGPFIELPRPAKAGTVNSIAYWTAVPHARENF